MSVLLDKTTGKSENRARVATPAKKKATQAKTTVKTVDTTVYHDSVTEINLDRQVTSIDLKSLPCVFAGDYEAINEESSKIREQILRSLVALFGDSIVTPTYDNLVYGQDSQTLTIGTANLYALEMDEKDDREWGFLYTRVGNAHTIIWQEWLPKGWRISQIAPYLNSQEGIPPCYSVDAKGICPISSINVPDEEHENKCSNLVFSSNTPQELATIGKTETLVVTQCPAVTGEYCVMVDCDGCQYMIWSSELTIEQRLEIAKDNFEMASLTHLDDASACKLLCLAILKCFEFGPKYMKILRSNIRSCDADGKISSVIDVLEREVKERGLSEVRKVLVRGYMG